MSTADVLSPTKAAQVRLNRVTDSYFRVVLDNPPLNLMGPEFVWHIREIVKTLEKLYALRSTCSRCLSRSPAAARCTTGRAPRTSIRGTAPGFGPSVQQSPT